MYRALCPILLILCCCFPDVSFAGFLKGKITDSKGESLPFATVYIKGTTIGTSANAQAQYNLELKPGTYQVLCQYLGYEQEIYNLTIKGEETITHNFSLSPQTLRMSDVVIKADAEDPAYAIIRKAIKRRKFHKDQIAAFQTSIYMKAVLRNRSMPDKILGFDIPQEDIKDSGGGGADSTKLGVMYLSEQEAEYYSDGKQERTVIKSVRESGDPNGVGISRLPPVVSFYDNNVNPLWNLSERGFISPISDGALSYYKYEYMGQFMRGDYTINKIIVTPKRAYEPLFYGAIYIVENDWAIYGLDLTLTHKSNLEQLDTLRIEQSYLLLKEDTWVIKSQVQYPTLGIFGFDFTGNFVAVYDNQKVNEKIPDTMFNNKIISSYLSDANDVDTGSWKDKRPVPLEEDEIEDYQKKDSLYARYRSPEYSDSIRRRRNKFSVGDIINGGLYHATKDYKTTFRTNSLMNGFVTYNTVEGLAITPKINTTHFIDTGKAIYTVLGARYGFGNKHFNSFGRVTYRQSDRHWLRRYWQTGIEGGRYVYQYNPNSTIEQVYNTFSTIVYGKNLLKLYERYTAAAFLTSDFGNGFSFNVKAGFQRRLPLANTSYFTLANNDPEKWTSNVPAPLQNRLWETHNAVLAKASLSYRPGTKYIQYPKFKSPVYSEWPMFTLSYEKGIPNILNSKTDFDKWRFQIDDYVNLKLLGSLEYNVAAGGFLNANYVSLPDMMHIADNELFIAAPYVSGFQFAPYYMFSNTAELYADIHVEYNMNGLLTNKIPLFRQAQWNIVMGNNTIYMNNNNYYTEAFIGVDNIGYKLIRFLRVDVVRGWDHTGAARTGVRLGIDMGTLSSLGGISFTDDSERFEW